jgi:hypothetical protein
MWTYHLYVVEDNKIILELYKDKLALSGSLTLSFHKENKEKNILLI